MDFMFIILSISFLLTGLLSGLIAGLLGVGGGIIIIPITYFILRYLNYSNEVIMHISITSSLGIIVFTSISSLRSHIKLKNVDFDIIKKWIFGIILGSVAGAMLASKTNGEVLKIIFIILLLLISINMFLQKNLLTISNIYSKKISFNFFISLIIGFFSVLIGIGGGSFSVPLLSALKKPIHKAVGTSSVVGFFIAISGVVTYTMSSLDVEGLPPYSIGYANLLIVSLVSFTSVFSANIGAKLSSKTKNLTLKKIFAVFLFCTCISLIIENFIF